MGAAECKGRRCIKKPAEPRGFSPHWSDRRLKKSGLTDSLSKMPKTKNWISIYPCSGIPVILDAASPMISARVGWAWMVWAISSAVSPF